MKRKYFKIQAHNYGIQSIVTNQTLKQHQSNLLKQQLSTSKNSINLIENLFTIQSGRFNINLMNDLRVLHMKQNPLVKLENSVQIKKINKFKISSNEKCLYFLINIAGYLNNLVQCFSINMSDLKRNSSNVNYHPIRFNHLNDHDEFYGISQTLRSSGLAYIQNNNYLVIDHYPSETNQSKKQKISISFIDYYNREQLNEKLICVKNFVLPLWCSTLNSNTTSTNQISKCGIGLPKNGVVACLYEDRNEQILDSGYSDVYCIKFKPSVILISYEILI